MDKEKQKAFVAKVFADVSAGLTVGMVYVGVKTGLFAAMDGKGPLTLATLAQATGLQPRYLEEWAKGLVSAGYLEFNPEHETFELPPEHGKYLGVPGNLYYLGGLYLGFPATVSVAPDVAAAFRNGGGVHFEKYGEEFYAALDSMNQGVYENLLAPHWIPQVPEVLAALQNGGSALDVGCGRGRVSMSLAKGYPSARCTGLDVHPGSVEAARALARDAGVADRVDYVAGTIGDLPSERKFDLITFMDVVHDLTQPLETLRTARALLADGGTVFVGEPKVSHNVLENRNSVATMFYGMSLFHCMTQSLARGGPGLGACFGPVRLKLLAEEAGFTEFRHLEIPHASNSFFALRG